MNSLSKKITVGYIMRFVTPTICMMAFMSFYIMVDGIFVSNFVGTNALSAVNIVYPQTNVIVAIGVMLASGAGALVAKAMGEKKDQLAKQRFTLITMFAITIGVVITVSGLIFHDELLILLGAKDELYLYAQEYSKWLLYFTIPMMLQMLFQTFFVVAGKPMLGLYSTILGGVLNVLLDYVFLYYFNWGVIGAAVATGIGYSACTIIGLYYFTFNKNGSLKWSIPKFDLSFLVDSCVNGSSEMVTNVALAVITLLYNNITMEYLGVDGVAAITIILYAEFLLNAVYFGYSQGVSPLISYNYGEQNHKNLKKINKISFYFICIAAVFVFVCSQAFGKVIVEVFAAGNTNVVDIGVYAFSIYAISFLFKGFNTYTSALFTALSNGKVSAVLSFLRTFAFIAPLIIFLPGFIGSEGIWWAVVIAELVSIVISLACFIGLRKVYLY